MADITSAELQPVLKMDQTELAFPPGESDPEAVRELYANTYPHLRQATIREPEVRGDKLVYEVEKAPLRTKG
ncbi:MAG TPA: PRTRC system protein C [Gammaproteobacteria bacterium]|nr:PRTRC system protein C [Gammaproteobacteria bacterium]